MLQSTITKVAILTVSIITIAWFASRYLKSNSTEDSFSETSTVITPQNDSSFGQIFFNPSINDSLPYYKYKTLEDSIKNIKRVIEQNNDGTGTSLTFFSISIMEMRKANSYSPTSMKNDTTILKLQDSLTSLHMIKSTTHEDSVTFFNRLITSIEKRIQNRLSELARQENRTNEKLYYLGIDNYSPKDTYTKFFLANETYNIAYAKWDRIEKRRNQLYREGHYEQKKIVVRYSADDKRILIPIARRQYNVLYITFFIIVVAFIVVFVYSYIVIPGKIINSISKGKVLTLKNIQKLKLVTLFTLGWVITFSTMPHFLHFIYRKIIPEEYVLAPFYKTLLNHTPALLAGLVLLIITQAFKKGYQTHQEDIRLYNV